MTSSPVLTGRPARLDAVWRPVVRSLLAALGLAGSGLLAFFGQWVWAPLPLATALLVHEVVFWIRGDRPMRVALSEDGVSLDDPKNSRQTKLSLKGAVGVGLGVRRGDGGDEVFAVVYGDQGPLFAARFETQTTEWPSWATRLDALQPVLGGNAGIVRGFAPPDRIARQVLRDPTGAFVEALLQRAGQEDRVMIRVWRGQAPPVDFMGLHRGPPDAILTLVPGEWRLYQRFTGAVTEGRLSAASGGRAARSLELMDFPGAERASARLPLLVIGLGEGLNLAIPAPLAGHHGEEVALDDQTLHTHLSEGALLVGWLIRHQPPGALPPPLLQAISDARVAGELRPELARHLTARDTSRPAEPAPSGP